MSATHFQGYDDPHVTPRRIRDRVKAQAIREAAVARERGAQ